MPKHYKDMIDELINKMDEDAPANAVAHGGVAMPADMMPKDKHKKHKKEVQKRIYDGRTKEGKKFVERILARRAAREQNKINNQ